MSAELYDAIGAEYDKVKELPFARYVERPAFLTELGDVTGRAVLDLACGTGFYTRQIAARKPSRLVGVDISPEMVRIGRLMEEAASLGISYEVHDAGHLPVLGSFDVVTAAHLFNYAPDETALRRMCAAIRDNLSPGGRLMHVGLNPNYSYTGPSTSRYGFTLDRLDAVTGGHRTRFEALLDPPISFEVYHLRPDVYERALKHAGFIDVRWVPASASDEGVERYGAAHWSDWVVNPVLVTMHART